MKPSEKILYKQRVYELASLIAIKYGGFGAGRSNYKYEHIRELWKYGDPYPALTLITERTKINEVKWFIHHRLNYQQDEIWNSDFLMGLSVHGKIRWSKIRYPSFIWEDNQNITELVSKFPFGGVVRKNIWSSVPAFYLKYSKDSLSYIAGVMAGTQLVEESGIQYTRVDKKTIDIFKGLKIPIEKESDNYYLLSPIWAALFSIKMPEFLRSRWLELKNPYGVESYAPILWRTYVDSNFPKGKFPYLPSRRTVYYHYGIPDESLKDTLGKLRVEKGMTEIDNRIRDAVKLWEEKMYNEEKETNEILTH